MRYRAIVAYEGSGYQGFQRQTHGGRSVVNQLEQALTDICGQPVEVVGAGRTDAGVHATGQVIAFDLDWRHTEQDLIRALNIRLPTDIAIQRVEGAEPGFNPRYDALSRTYEYCVYVAEARHPRFERQMWHQTGALDSTAMNNAAALLIGAHDFASFGSPPRGDKGTTRRTVYQSAWHVAETPPISGLCGRSFLGAQQYQFYNYTIEANAFLYRMVRAIVGSLVEIGRGRMQLDAFADAFQAKDRSRIRHMAPPQGLTLVEVKYKREQTPAGA